MPVRQMAPTRSNEHWDLVNELLGEWRTKDSQNAEPIIFEEPDRQGRIAHVYVIWSKWVSMEQVERSEIIMEAAEKKFSQDDLLNISIAMGLTPPEATGMGLRY